LDYSYIVRNFNFFGEVGRSANAAMAYLTGVLLSVDSRTSIDILYRNYAKDYQALQSNGFKEGSSTSNEKGIYIGISSNLTKYLVFSAYYDQFSYPWLSYLADAPLHGNEYLVQLSYTPNKKFQMNIRFKENTRQNNSGDTYSKGGFPFIPNLVKIFQNDLRWTSQYKFSNSLRFAERIDFTQFARGDQSNIVPATGFLISQDVILKIPKTKLSITFRYALFDCNSYYTRLFVSGGDVPNSFSIPSFYNQGSMTNLMLQYHLIKGMDLWLRVAQTVYSHFYNNIQAIGTGLDLINGNTKTDISAEVKISF
jgi:hypothetical protein